MASLGKVPKQAKKNLRAYKAFYEKHGRKPKQSTKGSLERKLCNFRGDVLKNGGNKIWLQGKHLEDNYDYVKDIAGENFFTKSLKKMMDIQQRTLTKKSANARVEGVAVFSPLEIRQKELTEKLFHRAEKNMANEEKRIQALHQKVEKLQGLIIETMDKFETRMEEMTKKLQSRIDKMDDDLDKKLWQADHYARLLTGKLTTSYDKKKRKQAAMTVKRIEDKKKKKKNKNKRKKNKNKKNKRKMTGLSK